jgi:tetratricopeptide (TPR) repeat protein
MMFTPNNRIRPLAWGLVLAAGLAACASVPPDLSEDTTAEKLVQRAQEASDKNNYKTALLYYQALLERNQTNYDWILTAEYEIAFIHYKQKKYGEAREEFNALLLRYESPDAELLPQQFKRLSTIVLKSIDEKEARLRKFRFPKARETPASPAREPADSTDPIGEEL